MSRDEVIATAILQNMNEAQKQQVFEVIKSFEEVKSKLAPIFLAGEELHMLPSVKVSFGFSGQMVLER